VDLRNRIIDTDNYRRLFFDEEKENLFQWREPHKGAWFINSHRRERDRNSCGSCECGLSGRRM